MDHLFAGTYLKIIFYYLQLNSMYLNLSGNEEFIFYITGIHKIRAYQIFPLFTIFGSYNRSLRLSKRIQVAKFQLYKV